MIHHVARRALLQRRSFSDISAGLLVSASMGSGVAGAASQAALVAQLRAAGGEIVEDIPVRDHAPFARAELERLLALEGQVDGIFMTAKDRVKAQPLLEAGCTIPLVVPRLRMRFHSGQAALIALLEGAMSG